MTTPGSTAPPSVQPVARSMQVMQSLFRLGRESDSVATYWSAATRIVGEAFQAPYAVLERASGASVQTENYHSGPSDPAFWAPAVRAVGGAAVAELQPQGRPYSTSGSALGIALIGSPLFEDGEVIGSIALAVPCRAEKLAEAVDRLGHIALALEAAAAIARARAAESDRMLAGIARGAASASAEALASALTTSLSNKFGALQAALGIVERGRVRVLDIARMDSVPKRSSVVDALRGAMDECLDAGTRIACRREAVLQDAGARYRLHDAWRETLNAGMVVSYPLQGPDGIAWVVSMAVAPGEELDEGGLQQTHAALQPLVDALLLMRRAERSLGGHALDLVRDEVQSLRTPSRWRRTALIAGSLLAAAWFCFGTLTHSVTVNAIAQPTITRQVSLPFAGRVVAVHVVPGAQVQAGDVIAELDRTELEFERSRLLAEARLLEERVAQAYANEELSQARVLAAQRAVIDARLQRVAAQIEGASIRAPIDGMVVGDARSLQGAVLELGAPLLEVIDGRAWRIELEAPDLFAADLEMGQEGMFRAAARPDAAVPIAIDLRRPSFEARDTQNVFVLEASLDEKPDWLRPGMEGAAQIEVGARRVWWIALHRVDKFLRSNFWL